MHVSEGCLKRLSCRVFDNKLGRRFFGEYAEQYTHDGDSCGIHSSGMPSVTSLCLLRHAPGVYDCEPQ
jgi:hypothetical protein